MDNTRGGFFRKPYLEKMVRFLDKMGKRDEAIAALEANKDKNEELRLLYVDMLTERKMYDHLVKFCMHTLYRAEENLEKYAKYMSESDQRLVAQDIIERMKRRAPECKRGDDYDHFAGWIRRLYNSSPECEKIERGSGGGIEGESE